MPIFQSYAKVDMVFLDPSNQVSILGKLKASVKQ
jgi:hypothetical protein